MNLQLNVKDYNDWAETKFIEYASTTVGHGDRAKRLVIGKYLNAHFKVSLGDEIMMLTNNAESAIQAFNDQSY
jgi:hypothetical protein